MAHIGGFAAGFLMALLCAARARQVENSSLNSVVVRKKINGLNSNCTVRTARMYSSLFTSVFILLSVESWFGAYRLHNASAGIGRREWSRSQVARSAEAQVTRGIKGLADAVRSIGRPATLPSRPELRNTTMPVTDVLLRCGRTQGRVDALG